MLSLGVTDFNLLELIELNDGASQVHDVLASLREGIKPHKKCVCGDFPLVLSLAFVFEIGIFEFRAYLKGESELIMSFLRLFILDEGKDLITINVVAALIDDGIADLSDEDHKSRRCVVTGRIFPDQQDDVHGRHKEIWDLSEILASIGQLVEEVSQCSQVLMVLIGFMSGSLDFLLEL